MGCGQERGLELAAAAERRQGVGRGVVGCRVLGRAKCDPERCGRMPLGELGEMGAFTNLSKRPAPPVANYK